MKVLTFLMTVALMTAAGQTGSTKKAPPMTTVAQTGNMKQAPPIAAAAKATGTGVGNINQTTIPLQVLGTYEKEMDGRISSTGATINDPCIVLGAGSRGLYLAGTGVIFMADAELVISPGGPFQTSHSPAEKAAIHKRKQAHVALLQQTMRDMALSLSASPSLKLTDNDQVVVAIRLVYRTWEDTSGLPGQLVARIEHRGGQVVMEVQ